MNAYVQCLPPCGFSEPLIRPFQGLHKLRVCCHIVFRGFVDPVPDLVEKGERIGVMTVEYCLSLIHDGFGAQIIGRIKIGTGPGLKSESPPE